MPICIKKLKKTSYGSCRTKKQGAGIEPAPSLNLPKMGQTGEK